VAPSIYGKQALKTVDIQAQNTDNTPLSEQPSASRRRNLANSAQSRKRARQAEKRRQHNAPIRTRFRSAIKDVQAAVKGGDKTAAEAAYKNAVSIIDKTEQKGLIHENKAARHKSRLNTQLRGM
jgi:small subunit ribosomal protein S20